ncbi:MAG: LysR substrate-binding domain-containing protein [Burkholderiales bacterium]|jgi:DNA-binding transcriptional LysR family regulator
MQVRLPSLEALRALEVCIRLGSFERAAEELHITPSAVSKRLAALEDMLGIILLQRQAKPLKLTEVGSQYWLQVQPALQTLAAVSWHRPSQQRSQRLRIASTPTFARQILVPELPAFTARHPGQEIELVLSLPHAAHDTPEADVEIRFANPTLVEGEVLLHEQAFLMAAPSLLARHTIQNATDLRDLCLLRCPLEPWAPWFAAAGLDWPEPQQGPSMLDMGLILEAAVAGQGVALSRRSLARRWLDSGALRPVLAEQHITPLAQYCVSQAPSPAARAFVQWLRQTLHALAAD